MSSLKSEKDYSMIESDSLFRIITAICSAN